MYPSRQNSSNVDESAIMPPMETEPKRKKWKSELIEILVFTIIALAIVIPLRLFIAQPFVVSGDSMVPTFEDNDYLIIDEISYIIGEPKRGDVVIFRFPQDPDRFFIKRVIGLPNETVEIKNNQVIVYNNDYPEGFILQEDHIVVPTEGSSQMIVGDNEYFVMGDNRVASSDSRYWGPVPEKCNIEKKRRTVTRDCIVGRALIRLLPIKEIGILPGAVKLEDTNPEINAS